MGFIKVLKKLYLRGCTKKYCVVFIRMAQKLVTLISSFFWYYIDISPEEAGDPREFLAKLFVVMPTLKNNFEFMENGTGTKICLPPSE